MFRLHRPVTVRSLALSFARPRSIAGALGLLLVAGTTLACTPPRPTSPVASADGVSLVADGRGYGHGVGLSQWGAYGRAVYGGQDWSQILAAYYGGTGLGSADAGTYAPLPSGWTSVRLTALDDQQTSVVQLRGQATVLGDPVPGRLWGSVVVREVPGQQGRYRVYAHTTPACAAASDPLAGWTLVADGAAGPVAVSTATGADPAAAAPFDLLGACESDGEVRYYRGALQAVNGTDGENRTVNAVPMEQYLRSVVANEMSGSWGAAGGGAGMNALRAQAVAARSYTLSETSAGASGLKYSYAKTCDNTACQYYPGAMVAKGGPTANLRSLEHPNATVAVDETAGVILRDGRGAVVRGYFSASNGGRTAAGPFPVVDDPLDGTKENPNHTWRVAVPATTVEKAWPGIGRYVGATVVARDGTGGPWGGRATMVEIRGTAGTVTVAAATVRTALGLKSTWFALA